MRPQRQHHRHDHEHQHQGRLGQQHDAEGLQHPDQQRGQISARQAAQAADHNHDEGIGDHVEVDLQIG